MTNSGESALFMFLDFTAVFDTVDHSTQNLPPWALSGDQG